MTVPATSALQGYELVAHVFLPVGRPAEHAAARGLWDRAVAGFGLSDPVATHPATLPAEPPEVTDDESLLAARSGPARGVHQIVARRVHDVLCVSLVSAPAAADGWEELAERWRVAAGTSSGVLGSVLIRQARLRDPAGRPADVDPASVVPGRRRWIGGPVEPERRIGPVALWEALDDDADPAALDGRRDRKLVVVAAADRDPQLSAFTWSRGGRALTPFGHYLLHAAKLRHAVRTRSTTVRALPRLRAVADRAHTELAPHVGAGRVPAAALPAARATLADAAAADLELATRHGLLGELRDFAAEAETNMGRYAGRDRAAEPFADDRAVAAWLHEQLGRDLAHVDGPRTRLREVVAAARRVVPDAGQEGPLTELVARALLDDGGVLEHVVRVVDGFQNPAVFWAGLHAGLRRVCLVDVPGAAAEGGGTGFLVGPDLLLTNHHVLADVIAGTVPAANVSCLFDHAVGPDGGVVPGVAVALAGDWMVAASPPSPADAEARPAGPPGPDELDYALVRLAHPVPGPPDRGCYDLLADPPPLGSEQTVLVLQHPEGQRIKMAFGPVLGVDAAGTRVFHHVNTAAGSSGGPCLTLDMRLAALHQGGSPRDARAPHAPKVNAAVPIAAIRRHLLDGGFAEVLRPRAG